MTVLLQPVAGQDRGLFGHKRELAPPTLTDVARMIDHIESSILNQGTVVIKQPDIWSQGRMTMFRKEFEDTMRAELGGFKPLLSARIARSDFAGFASQTALGASLSALDPDAENQFSSFSDITKERDDTMKLIVNSGNQSVVGFSDPTKLPAAANFGLLNSLAPVASDSSSKAPSFSNMQFGLEPNVELDQHADYITHLHRLRRVNLGDDNTDSAGYELYLMRIPVSIQPGDHTVKGHGAVLTVTMRHDFAPKFLYSTYRNLVINDVIDKLAAPTHELVRTGNAYKFMRLLIRANQSVTDTTRRIIDLKNRLTVEVRRGNSLPKPVLDAYIAALGAAGELQAPERLDFRLDATQARDLENANNRLSVQLDEVTKLLAKANEESEKLAESKKPELELIEAARLKAAITNANTAIEWSAVPLALENAKRAASMALESIDRSMGASAAGPADELSRRADTYERGAVGLRTLVDGNFTLLDARDARIPLERDTAVVFETIATSLRLQEVAKDFDDLTKTLGKDLSASNALLTDLRPLLQSLPSSLPASRSGSRINAIAPTDVPRAMVEENLVRLAYWTHQALGMGAVPPGAEETSAELSKIDTHKVRLIDVRSFLRHELEAAYDLMLGPDQQRIPVLADVEYIEGITELVASRQFERAVEGNRNPNNDDNDLEQAYEGFVQRLPGNLRARPLGVLSWAIAIEAGLLNRHLREDMRQTKGANDYTAPANLDAMYFYMPTPDPDTELAFQEYVKARWPMITFALEPVVDQQNIEDAFTRRRDLQLAIAFALSSGRISFRQAMNYTRQLQYEAQTIALNQTVSAFAHGNDTFGWRFTPRYQTPPEPSNARLISGMLLRGGEGPNYQIKNSKIEPGLRELTAVVVMPSFVRGMRVDASSDWFRLHDPDERKISTARTVELGRKINEARQCLEAACQCGLYRPEDVERLRIRLHQLEAMLPMQTSFVKVPYENAVGGFALFTQGASALVPELSGFEGIEYIDIDKPTDVIVYGKHFSIYESAVVVGGVSLPREGAESYTVQDPDGNAKLVGTSLTPLRDTKGNLLLFKSDGTKIDVADNGSYDILSREVMRVRIPAKVAKAKLSDGREIVELYVSTPNGISNRLQIPVRPTPKAPEAPKFGVPSGPGMAFIDGSVTVQVEARSDAATPPKILLEKTRKLPPQTVVRIAPLNPEKANHDQIDLQLNFSVSTGTNTAATITVPIPGVPRDPNRESGFYVIQSSQLDTIAETIFKRVTESNLTLSNEVSTRKVLVTTMPNASDSKPVTSEMTNSLKIVFEIVLQPRQTQANATAAPPTDRALALTTLATPAPVAASLLPTDPLGTPPFEFTVPDIEAELRLTAIDQRGPATARTAAYQTPQVPAAPALGGLNPQIQAAIGNAAAAAVAAAAATNAGNAATNATNAANQAASNLSLPNPTTPSLLVVPQGAPNVRVNVPITNSPAKHKGLFNRGGNNQPARRPLLDRIMNGP